MSPEDIWRNIGDFIIIIFIIVIIIDTLKYYNYSIVTNGICLISHASKKIVRTIRSVVGK